jgi:LemA protein
MKKFLLIILAVIVVLALWIMGQYNSLIAGKANVDKAWADVQVQYQRRSDIIPGLEAIVSGAANFEKSTLIGVVEARAKATSITVDPTNAQSMAQFTAAQSELSGALSRLLVSVEAYPDIKTSQNFRDLQSQLEGTENRIGVARGDFNNAATIWNASTLQFPKIFIARLFGFEKVAPFNAEAGADTAPTIDFTIK